MTAPAVELYFDLGSPYAYLALARAADVLGRPPELEPVLLGAIFKLRGFGSWSQTPRRAEGVAEVERRAAAYGLPAVRWPEGWPADGLRAMRAATWARQRGRLDAFATVAFEHEFVHGRDICGVDALAAVAEEVGLPGDELRAAIESPDVKDRLREATAHARELGVRGVPTVRVGARLFYGDDQLEALRRTRGWANDPRIAGSRSSHPRPPVAPAVARTPRAGPRRGGWPPPPGTLPLTAWGRGADCDVFGCDVRVGQAARLYGAIWRLYVCRHT